jgi:hypothetical protein
LESPAFICPAQCSIPDIAEPGAGSKLADMRAHAMGALITLSATAKNAMKSLDLRPDICWSLYALSLRDRPRKIK